MAKKKRKTIGHLPRIDRKLYNALVANYSRGAIVMVGAGDHVGKAVREGQRTLTRDGEPSRWSHCFLFGEQRLTFTAAGRHPKPGPYIFESDLQVSFDHAELRNGAQENWLGRWCRPDIEHCAIIDYQLPEDAVDVMLAAALHLVDTQLSYPLQDLLGTWFATVRNKLWSSNPFKSKNAMYCSSFVRYCYRKAGHDFMRRNVSLSNTAPEHVARAGEKQDRLLIIR